MLAGLFYHYPDWCDTKQLSETTGEHIQKVANTLSKWFAHHYKYASRRKVKGNKYVYKIRKHGMRTLMAYKRRYELGFDLNRNRKVPKKIDKYVILNNYGINMSMKEEDLPHFEIKLGISKN
jgi:hypothetical protein